MTDDELNEIEERLQKIGKRRLVRKKAIHISNIAEESTTDYSTTEWFYPIKTRAHVYYWQKTRRINQSTVGFLRAQWSGDKPLAEFLVNAPDDVRALIEEIKRLRSEINQYLAP